jgi:hypothetical protein
MSDDFNFDEFDEIDNLVNAIDGGLRDQMSEFDDIDDILRDADIDIKPSSSIATKKESADADGELICCWEAVGSVLCYRLFIGSRWSTTFVRISFDE